MGPLALPAVTHGRTGMGDAADRPVHGCIRPGRYPHHTGPGFRGREKRRVAGAAGASHEVIRFGSRREASHELVRVGNRRDRKMAGQSSIRGHHAFVFRASGGGATGHHPHRLHRGENGGRAVLRSAPAALRRAQADHHLRSLFTRSGGGPEADGHRGHLPGRLGHVGQGIRDGGPGTRPGQLSALPGARRGRADRARPAHGGPEPALRPLAPERGAACCLPGDRLSAIHHRRRRHRTRRRRARPESDPSVRRGRGPGLPHRGPEARRQEVRAPGGQGARRRGRADQAAERRPLPARRHEGARHHRGPDRRRSGHLPGGARGRARSSVHPGRHQR